MAEPSQLTQHIESFVDSSRSSTQQAASLDAIVSFVKNDVVTISSLVREMEMYLTTTDSIIRARGILLLGEALKCLSSKPLDAATIHSMTSFFKERLADWRALRGALVGCLALVKRKSGGMVISSDAKGVAESFLQNLQVQSLGQHDRKLCFELMECLLEHYPHAVASLGDDLIYGICEAIDGEKDPQCLMLAFHIMEVLVRVFPDPCGPIESFASDLFGILSSYFPIHFTHPKAEEDVEVKRDDLSRALMLALSSSPLFEPSVIPLLLEKLSSSLSSAKVDSLKYLSYCTSKYGAERIAKHAGAIWSSLKDAIFTSGQSFVLSFTPESLGGLGCQENEIAAEALALLEKVVIQNNDLFSSMIVGDEEINMVLNSITGCQSYNEIPLQSTQKLYSVGRILYVSVKASVASCSRIFQYFFSCLMESMGLPVVNGSGTCSFNDDCMISKRPDHGSLYLCVELLGACRDLAISSGDLASQCVSANETWCCLLQRFSTSLSKIFSSTLATTTDKPAHDADVYLGVKGLQILATFPGGYLLVSKSTCESILMTFVSIITVDFNKTLLWKLSVKALVQIGLFIHGSNESEKSMSYMDIVVQKIVSMISSDNHDIPFQLQLEAISDIGTSGLQYMLKIVTGLQEVICANLAEVYVQGNVKSAKVIIHLLECYSNELLPWIQKYEVFEEVLLQFVVCIWNQIENCMAFPDGIFEKELLDATMKVMKLVVASCSVESQNIIIDKAYAVLSSSTFLSMKDSLSSLQAQLEELEDTQETDKFSSRDEWIHSLFTSVIIALRPQTRIPNIRTVLHFLMIVFLKGYVTAAQALGSLVNKLDLKTSGTEHSGGCTFEEAMDIIFDSGLLKIRSIDGLAWIGKGLLMRGHEKVKDITIVFLECLQSNGRMGALPLEENNCNWDMRLSAMKCAADAFQVLMSDSEPCLNRKFHAIIRPLYKQRFFSTIMPILQSLIIQSDSLLSRSMLYRAFANVVIGTPLIVILNDAKKLIPMVLDSLKLLSKDVLDKDIMYSLLLVLSGILTDKNGQEGVIENAHIIINYLIGCVTYPHTMLVRETTIQCLVAMSELPHTRIYPMRIQVLQAVSKALDDPKRAVRQEAVRCRQAWSVI
ncbi:MMS19 nucleotide excision repair protein homolog isoform X2 [Populus alba]|uniref:MMS19 nucleotide excision repair protein homolog isoform X2 n=1 Tax=Populus alba TaxID=43335 RepID=UPI003CC7340D